MSIAMTDMNSNYLKFNNWAFNYYIDRNAIDKKCTLAIETSEVDNYGAVHNCDFIFKEIVSDNWAKLLKNTTENNLSFPKYFGLLALQCYAAAKMHREGDVRANNFKFRFSEISGFASSQDLELSFSTPYKGVPIQEYIWMHAREYLYNQHNLQLVIPQQSVNAGRYVQYPKFQIVLNEEDLREYIIFFKDVDNKYDGISENEFQRYYKQNIFRFSSSFVRKNNLDISFSHLQKKIKLKQIFDFYSSGNWSTSENVGISRKSNIEKEKYVITLLNNEIKIYDSYCREVLFPDSLKLKARDGDVIMFKKSPDYLNEYDITDVLEFDIEKLWIVSECNVFLRNVLSRKLALVHTDCKGILIYKGSFSEDGIPKELVHKVVERFPVRLKGFKLSRRREYLTGYAPEIIKESDVALSVYYNNIRLTQYDRKNAGIGKYTIRIPGYSCINFEIVESPALDGLVYNSDFGWKTSTFSMEHDTYDIRGFLLKSSTDYRPLTINNWIKVQSGKIPAKETKPTNNLLLKVLEGCKYKKYTR